MVDYNLIEDIGLDDAELTSLLAGIQSGSAIDGAEPKSIEPGSILKGRVVGMSGDFVIVDVGLKSEGQVDKAEFEDTGVAVGDEVEVLLEQMEEGSAGFASLAALARRRATGAVVSAAKGMSSCTSPRTAPPMPRSPG
jgi:ribosomal protein S1